MSRDIRISGSVLSVLLASIWALGIKVLSALFSYLMFVALAKVLGQDDFGVFGFAFSLGLFFSKLGGGGQDSLMVRVLPRHDGDMDSEIRTGAIRFGYGITLGMSVLLALALAAYLVIREPQSEALDHALLATALFFPVMALADVQAGILRGHGSVVGALAPRDVVWRALMTGGAFLWVAARFGDVEAGTVLNACAVSLAMVLAVQAVTHRATRPWRVLAASARYDFRDWGRLSVPFWLTAVVSFGAPTLSVVVLGLVIPPEETGPFFAAVKTAQLMSLLLLAASMVSSPLISRQYGRGDQAAVQAICAVVALASTCFAAGAFAFIAIAGDGLLTMFGEGFARAHPELVVVAIGYLINAACGPNGALLNMTAHQTVAMRITVIVNAVGLAVLPVATLLAGSLGAAAAVAGITVAWNLWMVVHARRTLGIDPSIVGCVRLIRPRAYTGTPP